MYDKCTLRAKHGPYVAHLILLTEQCGHYNKNWPPLLQFRRDLKTALHVSVIVLFTIVSSCVTDCNFHTAKCPCNGLVREVSP